MPAVNPSTSTLPSLRQSLVEPLCRWLHKYAVRFRPSRQQSTKRESRSLQSWQVDFLCVFMFLFFCVFIIFLPGVWFIVTVVIFVACTFVTWFNKDQSINFSRKKLETRGTLRWGNDRYKDRTFWVIRFSRPKCDPLHKLRRGYMWNKLFQNYFTGLLQLTNIFQHVRCRWNNFEVILELLQRLK